MEKPDWNRGDGIRSLKDFGSLVLDTIVEFIPLDIEIKDEKKETLSSLPLDF